MAGKIQQFFLLFSVFEISGASFEREKDAASKARTSKHFN
jgi:hypothetical protein